MPDGMSAANAGLVPSKTSCPRLGAVVGAVTPENTRKARLKRMRRSVLNSTRALKSQRKGFRDKWKMVTLTYDPCSEWEPKDVALFLNRVRKWVKRRQWHFSYVWVMELMQSGKPHYHVLIRIPYRGTLLKSDTVGWWSKGSTNTITAKNAVGYIAKYASKTRQKDTDDFPKGARIHGAAGLTSCSRTYVQFWNLPLWAREQLETKVQKTKKIKGGFVSLETGQFLETPYVVVIAHGAILIYEKEI